MAVAPLYLGDKRALARLHDPAVRRRLGPLLVEGLVATCPIIDLQVLFSARSHDDYEAILNERRALPSFPIDEAVTARALATQRTLARRAQHRVPIPDLLIAAVGELN